MEGNPQNLLIFLTALICSTGMGMPVSGFPNQTACVLCHPCHRSSFLTALPFSATQEDDMGQLYLTNIDFLKNGVPASVIATMVGSHILVPYLPYTKLFSQVVSTVGYLLMTIM